MTVGILQFWKDRSIPIPLWIDYGIPKQFKDRIKAEKWIKKYMHELGVLCEVRDMKVIIKYTKMLVEMYSERIKVNASGNITSVNNSMRTYEEMLPWLIKSAKSIREETCIRKTGNTLRLVVFKKRN